MKTRIEQKHPKSTEHPSPVVRKLLLTAERHRAGYERRIERLKRLGKLPRKNILIAACACACALLAAAPGANAAPPNSASALFNEANAAQRAGRLGPAILDYERASLLAPGDKRIAQNVSAAREKAGVEAPVVPIWQRPAHWVSFNALAALASISLLLISLLFFGTRLIPASLAGLSRVVAMSLAAIVLLAAAAIAARWPELDRAVIVGTQPVAHIAPARNAAPVFEPKPGEIVRAGITYGDFVRIRAADGRSGWIPAHQIARIIPAEA